MKKRCWLLLQTLSSKVVQHVEPGRERLLQLARLLGVGDDERVEVARAADLELGHASGGLLDADGAGVLAAGGQEEVLDLVDLLRLGVFEEVKGVEVERERRG